MKCRAPKGCPPDLPLASKEVFLSVWLRYVLDYDSISIKISHVGSEVLTEVVMKIGIFWDIM
jgi:hypothetical protein